MIDQVKTTRLPNGLTVLTEHMPGLRSVSLGIWVRRGSRHESPVMNGMCAPCEKIDITMSADTAITAAAMCRPR